MPLVLKSRRSSLADHLRSAPSPYSSRFLAQYDQVTALLMDPSAQKILAVSSTDLDVCTFEGLSAKLSRRGGGTASEPPNCGK